MHNLTEGLAAVVEDVYQNISTEYSQSALHEVVAYIQDEDSSLHFLLDYVPAFITDYLPASRTGAGTNINIGLAGLERCRFSFFNFISFWT